MRTPKSKKVKYWVHYVDDSTPKFKSFDTEKKAKDFVSEFPTDLDNGYWIDFLIKGSMMLVDETYREVK